MFHPGLYNQLIMREILKKAKIIQLLQKNQYE